MKWEDGIVTGFIGGKPVKTMRLAADPLATTLEVKADRPSIAAQGRDSVRVMVRALDQAGRKLPFFSEPVEIAVHGPAKRLGPTLVPLRGGATGFWLESTGAAGPITVRVTSPRLGTTTVTLAAVGEA